MKNTLFFVVLALFALDLSHCRQLTNGNGDISADNATTATENINKYPNQMNFTQEELEPPRALPLGSEMAFSAAEAKSGSTSSTAPNATLKFRNHTNNGSVINDTGYFLENDEVDNSFTDIQTLFLACFATLMPLVLIVMVIFLIRFLWRRRRRSYGIDGEAGRVLGGAPNGDASTDPLSKAAMQQSCEELKSSDSLFPLPNPDNSSDAPRVIAAPNGSVITMTLQDNHLIVETMTEDTLESPSVETEASSQADTGSVIHVDTENLKTADRLPMAKISTGLSQSDLSLSSVESYRYGSQLGYEAGYYGYPLTDVSPCGPKPTIEEFQQPAPVDGDKPIIRSALLKQDSMQNDPHQQRLNSDACAFERRMEAKRVIEEENEKILAAIEDTVPSSEQKIISSDDKTQCADMGSNGEAPSSVVCENDNNQN